MQSMFCAVFTQGLGTLFYLPTQSIKRIAKAKFCAEKFGRLFAESVCGIDLCSDITTIGNKSCTCTG